MTNTIAFRVPEEHPCFAGHFPDYPLVPGALTLAWLRNAITSENQLKLSTVKQAKFIQAVLPGDDLNFEWQMKNESSLSAKVLRDGQTLVSVSYHCTP